MRKDKTLRQLQIEGISDVHDMQEVYKIHALSSVRKGLALKGNGLSATYFRRSLDETVAACKEKLRVQQGAETGFVIFKAIAVVQLASPPIEIVDLEE